MKALRPVDNKIYVSDHQLRHSVRDAKKRYGGALPVAIIRRLPEKLAFAEWFYDAVHNNVLAVFDVGSANTVGKSVVAVNFKKGKLSLNSVVTSGIISPAQLGNPIYRKINDKP